MHGGFVQHRPGLVVLRNLCEELVTILDGAGTHTSLKSVHLVVSRSQLEGLVSVVADEQKLDRRFDVPSSPAVLGDQLGALLETSLADL